MASSGSNFNDIADDGQIDYWRYKMVSNTMIWNGLKYKADLGDFYSPTADEAEAIWKASFFPCVHANYEDVLQDPHSTAESNWCQLPRFRNHLLLGMALGSNART